MLDVGKEKHSRGPFSAAVRKRENVQFMQEIEDLLGLDSEFPEDYVCDLLHFMWSYFFHISFDGMNTPLDKIWFDRIDIVLKRLIKKGNKKYRLGKDRVSYIWPDENIKEIDPFRYPIPAFFMQEAPSIDLELLELKVEGYFSDSPMLGAIKHLFFRALIVNKKNSELEKVADRLRLALANPCLLHIEIIKQVSQEYGFRNLPKLSGFLDDLSADHCYRKTAIFEDVASLAELARFDHYSVFIERDVSLEVPTQGEVDDQPRHNRSWEARYQRITSNRYARFTPIERRQVFHVLADFLISQDRSKADSAAVVFLMYVTGMPQGELLAAQVGDQDDFSADGKYQRCLRRPMKAYEPPAELASLFEAYQDRIKLQLPAIILPWMRERLDRKCGTLLGCMGGDEVRVRKNVELLMDQMRDSGRFPRIRIERISAALAVELAIKYQDPAVTFYLSGRPNYVAPVLSYYVVHSIDELAYRYSQTVQELLDLPVSDRPLTGATTKLSGYFPTAEASYLFREGVSERFRLVLERKDDIISRHNAFTSYCLALLLLGTGHRPAQDPFPSLSHFDLDRGLLLINDKCSDQSRAWRLVALPETAVSQMREYLDYLPKLAAHLRQEYPSSQLPNRILRMTQGELEMLPLFFLLNPKDVGTHVSITESKLSTQWSEFWSLPVNFFRHIMATRLLNTTNRADYVQLQLGHMTGPDHPLGQTATEPALKTLGQIGYSLNKILRELGWDVVKHRMRLPSSGAVKSRSDKLRPITLGPALRLAVWQQKQSRAGELIKELVAEMPPRIGRLRQEELETLLQRVDSEAAERGFSVGQCRRVLFQYVRRQRGGKELLRQVDYARQVELEPSPFTEKTLENYRVLAALRRSFLDYMDQRGRSNARPTEDERLVEIVCSAALFGGIANSNRLKMLGHALQVSTYRYDGRLFVDISLGDDKNTAAVTRWFPDKISSSLIEGYYKVRTSERAPIVTSERAMQKLLGLIGSPGQESLDRLAANSKTGLTLEAPGYVAATATGDINSVSLPLSAWIRVESGHALQGKAGAVKVPQVFGWSPNLEGSATSLSSNESKAFLRQLKRIITAGKDAPRSASKGVNLQQKNTLIELLKNAVEVSPAWPALPKLLAAWVVHLCQNGTLYKSNLAYSTIDKYLMLVANRLCPATAELGDFLDFDGDDFERVYLSIVVKESQKNRFELARLLHAFHSFTVDSYLLDDLDWSVVMNAAGGSAPIAYADANYITSTEYQSALDAILQDTSLPDYQRFQCAGLLIWGYRFGLRFGEAFRLQYQDIQRKGGELYLWIRNTLHGEVKTNTSKRVAYLLEELSDSENGVLDKLLSTVKIDFDEDRLIPLMRSSAGSRKLHPRYLIAQYLGRLLKEVTGDESIRYHHLRHGFVTRQVGALAGVKVPGFSNETLKPWVRQEYANEKAGYPLHSVSIEVGHASEVTTLGSYTHCLDLIASTYYPDTESSLVSDFVAAYAEQVSPSTPRRRRARGGAIGWSAPVPSPDVKIRKHTAVSLEAKVWQPNLPRLPEFDLLLRRFSATGQTTDTATYLVVDPETAHAIVARATKVEALSGYQGYRLAERSDDPVARAGFATSGAEKLYKTETARIQVLLEKLAMQLEGMTHNEQQDFFAGVETWLQSTSRAQEDCIVVNFEELRTLVSMAVKLGASATILVDPGYDMKLLEELKIPVTNVIQKPSGRTAAGMGGLVVKLRSTPEIGSHRSLRRLLLLLATAGAFLYIERLSEH